MRCGGDGRGRSYLMRERKKRREEEGRGGRGDDVGVVGLNDVIG